MPHQSDVSSMHLDAVAVKGFPDDVCVAVVAHDAMKSIGACMQGIADNGCPWERVTVYDVAGTDGTGDWVAEHYPDVRVVHLASNDGPNPARNRAVQDSGTPFVLVMDADVQLLPGTVKLLRQTIGASERIGIATPVVLYADRPDTVQYRRTWVHFLAEASADVDPIPVSSMSGAVKRVGLASGCAPLIRKDAAIRAGLFEERYFFGKTDGEFAYRMTTSGFDIVEPAEATVLHHHRKRGSMFYTHQLCNRWHFMLKNFQLRTLVLIMPVLLIHEPLLFVVMLVMGKGGAYFGALRRLVGMLPALAADRRVVGRARRRHDWQVLRGDRLVVPRGIDRGGIIGLGVRFYRVCLNGYWSCARRALARISWPWPDSDVLLMEPNLPIGMSGEGEQPCSNAA